MKYFEKAKKNYELLARSDNPDHEQLAEANRVYELAITLKKLSVTDDDILTLDKLAHANEPLMPISMPSEPGKSKRKSESKKK